MKVLVRSALGCSVKSGFLGALAIVIVSCFVAPGAWAAEPSIDWTSPADFGELRRGYGCRDDYEAVCEGGRPSEAMVDGINQREFNEVAEVAL
jgi:hypothetical protein